MKLDKFAVVVLLVLIFGGAALFFSQQETEQREDREGGQVFSPALVQRMNDVAAIKILEKDNETNLVFNNNRWELQEKASYPADFSKIKKLIIDISELKTIESKTSQPEKYGRLGVQSVSDSGDVQSKQLDFADKAGNIIDSIILGKSKDARVPGSSSALYVRKANDAKSWLVSGSARVPVSHTEWLDKSIIDIKSTDINKVAITHPDKSRLTIEKATKEDKHFTILDLPAEAKLKSESIADSLANGLQNLSFTDVTPRKDFSLDEKKPTMVEFSTFDGLAIAAKLIEKDDKHFLLLDTHAKVEDQAMKDKAVELGTHLAQWAFEIASHKASNMNKTLDDLLENKESKEE